MKIWFDTEFIEDGKTIELLSIGLVREDGRKLYLEADWTDRSKAGDWVKQNVLPHLTGPTCSREFMRSSLVEFAGDDPEFWAWYASYDWVVLCQVFGTMMELPKRWPMFVRDWRQLDPDRKLAPRAEKEHNALADAIWLRDYYLAVTSA